MPSSAAAAAENWRAARRREAVNLLKMAGTTCDYAVRQLSDGIAPEEARLTALFMAGELARTGAALRRLTRPEPGGPQPLAGGIAEGI